MPALAFFHRTLLNASLLVCLSLIAACASSQSSVSPQKPTYSEAQAISLAQSHRENQYFSKAQSILSPFANAENGSAAAKIEYAELQLAMQAPDLAEIYARDALKQNADNSDALHTLAIALNAQEKTAEAGVIYKKAIEVSDGSPALLNDYAVNLAEQEQLEEAIKITKQSLGLDATNPDTQRNLRIFETLYKSKPKKKEKKAIPPKPKTKPEST